MSFHADAVATAPNNRAAKLPAVSLNAAPCLTTAAITARGNIANRTLTMPPKQPHGVQEVRNVTKLDYMEKRIGWSKQR